MILKKLILLVLVLETIGVIGHKKSRKSKDLRPHFPKYEEHLSDRLPGDVQVTIFLHKLETKQYNYWSLLNNLHLTLIITTCSSQIKWNLLYKANVTTNEVIIAQNSTTDVQKHQINSQQGLYILQLQSVDADTYIHLYMSTEFNGPEAFRAQKDSKLLIRRQRNSRVALKWDTSLVDPQGTEYCLITSTVRHYGSLCGAESARYGVVKPGTNYQQPVAASQTVISWEQDPHEYDPTIICTGKKTQYSLSNIKLNQRYYFDLIAINRQTNLTYIFASNTTIFSERLKPAPVKDGKLMFVNLKEYGGKVVFRFKIGRHPQDALEIYVMPCGGAVDVQVALKNEIVDAKRMIEGLGKLSIPKPRPSARYYIKIYSTNGEELTKTSGVQLYVTARSSTIPLPNMPSKPMVMEYIPLRTCDSVTIGWLPSPGSKSAHYCVVVKEGKLRDGFKQINQCGLESRLRKSADFTTKYCRDIKQIEGNVITQTINRLRWSKNYIIQITVKKKRGETISYDLLQVRTKSKCESGEN